MTQLKVSAASGLRMRAAANGDAVVAVLQDGAAVEQLERAGDWIRVRVDGWVHAGHVIAISPSRAGIPLGVAAPLPASPPSTSAPAGPGPSPAPLRPLMGDEARFRVFGRFEYERAPVAGNPEAIRILGDWARRNIVAVRIPQLVGIPGAPRDGTVALHRLVAAQALRLFAAWEAAGLLSRLRSWDGSFVPRLIRGGRTLSCHAFGTAFDVNVAWNGLGRTPAAAGAAGSVRELVPLAREHGFFWGGDFQGRPDGMHFEVAEVRP